MRLQGHHAGEAATWSAHPAMHSHAVGVQLASTVLRQAAPLELLHHFTVRPTHPCRLQYAHKACVQRWLNERPEKGSVLCEVCGKPLKGNWQLWRVVDDPLHPHLAALWHLLLHGSGGGEPRSASEEWAAPGLGAERRRVSGSTAWGLVLLLAASGVLFLRQVLRVVPSTGALLVAALGSDAA